MSASNSVSRQQLTRLLKTLDVWSELTTEAFALAESVHRDQLRASGGPYLDEHVYPVTANVARYLSGRTADDGASTVIVALLHDTIEDSDSVTEQIVNDRFGTLVASQVSILTKPEKRPGATAELADDAETRYVEGILAADFAVRVIKVFDRLNNLAAVHQRDLDRRRVYLDETRGHYLALANTVDRSLARQMAELLSEQEVRLEQEVN